MLGQCHNIFNTFGGLPAGLFLMALIGGFTHCAPMCGAFVLAQLPDQPTRGPVLQKLSRQVLIPYHLGRITTYILLAVVFNRVLNVAFLFLPTKYFLIVPALAISAVMFLVSAMPSLQAVFPWTRYIHLHLPQRILEVPLRFLGQNHSSVLSQYFLGVLLGLMPCGLVIAALMATSAAPDMLTAAFAMTAFGLGTLPALLLVSFGGVAFKKHYPSQFATAQRFLMLISSAWLFILAGYFAL